MDPNSVEIGQKAKGVLLRWVSGFDAHEFVPHYVLFYSGGIALSALVRVVMEKIKWNIPPNAVLMVCGIILGIICMRVPLLMRFTDIVLVNPAFVQACVVPGLLFKTAFVIDAHTFLRSWLQILIISYVGGLINAVFTGFIMKVMIDEDWSISETFMFGSLTVPIYSQEIISTLRDMGHQTKHLICLFEGEAMLGLSMAMICFRITDIIIRFPTIGTLEVCEKSIWYITMSLVVGFIIGKLVCMIIHSRYNNPLNIILWTLVSPYLANYICVTFISCSGVLAVIIIGIMISLERPGLPADLDHFLNYFWDTSANILESLMVLIIAVFSARSLTTFITIADFPMIIVTYVVSNVGRFLTLLLLAPLVSRIGYGFTFKKMIILIWGGLRMIVAVGAASREMDNAYGRFGVCLFSQMVALYLLTLIINGPTIKIVLKLLNMTEASVARKSNMSTCVKYVMSRRECSIAMLKMDRFLSDANWLEVQKQTMIKNPYKVDVKSEHEDDTFIFGFRQTICPDCNRDIIAEATPQELKEMTREARIRILHAQKACYLRQYENGLLTKDGIRVLTSAVELAIDSDRNWIDVSSLLKLFTKKTAVHAIRKYLLRVFFKTTDSSVRMPQSRCRRTSYHIIMHPMFDVTIFTVIALNTVTIALEMHYDMETYPVLRICIVAFNTIFFALYLAEFLLKVYGYATVYICSDGYKTYFRSKWNIFDFWVLIAAYVDLMLDYCDLLLTSFNKSKSKLSYFTKIIKLSRLIRIIRLFHLCKVFYPNIVKRCDATIDKRTAFSYEIGKSFVMTQQDILEMLPQMIDHNAVREIIRKDTEHDKLLITRQLGIIQKERPWIAITVKTKQAMLAALNTMMESVEELKMQGWVDDFELMKLMGSIKEGIKVVNMIKAVAPLEPKVLFQEVGWMGKKATSDFLYPYTTTKVFDIGDNICTEGMLSEGVFIVITGLLKMTYNPTQTCLEGQSERGRLPIVDYTWSPDFTNHIEEYIISGNTIGEISTITGRPYDCKIVAETPSQVYVIKRDVFRNAMKMDTDPIHGLESRIWKTLSMKLALSILRKIPAYQSHTVEKIKLLLERSFVPKLDHFRIFIVSDMIEDIILIEGVVVDYNSKDRFVGPCYISRTIQKIILIRTSSTEMTDETSVKLLIIPAKEVDEYELMSDEEEISELVPDAPRKFKKLSKKRKRRRRRKKTLKQLDSKISDAQDDSTTNADMDQRHVPTNQQNRRSSSEYTVAGVEGIVTMNKKNEEEEEQPTEISIITT